MKLMMFVSQFAEQAGKPRETQNVLNLNLPPKGSDQAPDENDALFAANGQRGASISISGLSAAEIAAFRGNPKVTVTIEPVASA